MKKITFIILDIVLISLAVWLAFILRFEGNIPAEYLEYGILVKTIFLVSLFTICIFYVFELYSFSWSYVSTNELISLFEAVTLSFGFSIVSIFIIGMVKDLPRSILFISYFLIFIFTGAIRFAKRMYLQIYKKNTGKERTLIVGAGDVGEEILRSILTANTCYLPIGFVDDDVSKQGIMIHGLKVLGTIHNIPKLIKENQIEQLIIALPSAGSETIKRAVVTARDAGLRKIKIVPSLAEIIDSQAFIKQLREIEIEDLLGREEVVLDTRSIGDFISNKVVLISGAAGSIGSELSRQIIKFKPSKLLFLDQDETGIFNISQEFKNLEAEFLVADIRDKQRIEQIFRDFKPNIVFHAAAYKHVPLMEKQAYEAVKNNIFGTKIMAEFSLKYQIEKFVFISTDKAVNPSSIMGATKRVGEMICQSLNQKGLTKFISVRFGNVLNSRGSVVPIFKEQIKKGGPVEITHPEMKRYIMITSEAVLLVMQAAAIGNGGEVFVLNMGKPISILSLAKELIKLSGFEPDKDIPIVFTEPRPGEKFFEEILTAEEGTIATENKNIFIAKLSNINKDKLYYNLKDLEHISNEEEIKNILEKIVSSYNSFNKI